MSLNGPTGDNTPDDPDEVGASGAPYLHHNDDTEWGSGGRFSLRDASAEPLGNRMTGDTALGCVGMLCLIATLALLGIGFGGLGLPFWLTALTPVLAFGVAALGFGLMARVPAGPTPRSRDPRHPLTRAGIAPIVERPAELANRLIVGASGALVVIAVAGYLAFSFDPIRARGLLWGPLVISFAGLALLVMGTLVSVGALPTLAIRWVRTPIQGRPPREGVWLLGVGGVAMASGLFLAFISGAGWAYIVVGALILSFAVVAMFYSVWQRRSQRRRLPPGYYAYSARRPDGPFMTHDHPDDDAPDSPTHES